MAITKDTRPYEILIRFNPDGEISGAHKRDIEEVKDGDQVYAAKELPAEAVKLTEANKKYIKGLIK